MLYLYMYIVTRKRETSVILDITEMVSARDHGITDFSIDNLWSFVHFVIPVSRFRDSLNYHETVPVMIRDSRVRFEVRDS